MSDNEIGKPIYGNGDKGAAFSELVSTPEWDILDNFYKALRHETFHRLHRCLWFKGIPTQDTMDWHDPQNEARNLAVIQPYFDSLAQEPLGKTITRLQAVLAVLQAQWNSIKGSRIKDWATAIQEWEGYYPGSRSYRNKNPGNLKFAGQAFAIGKDDENHAIFDTYQHGRDALIRQLTLAAKGQSIAYQPTMTIIEFQSKYAEANGIGYANYVAKRLGIPPSTKISSLL
jgi:hypothetical protein